MKQEIRIVTPNEAERLLAYNTGNRAIRKRHVDYFVRLIQQGEFQLTHQGAAFTGTMQDPGRILDGQHRLHAIVRAGIPTKLAFFWECDEATFAAIDAGVVRTFADHYGWDPNRIAVVRLFLSIANNATTKMTKTEADAVDFVFGHSYDVLLSVCSSTRAMVSTSATRAAAVLLMKQHERLSLEIAHNYRALVMEDWKHLPDSMCRLNSKLMTLSGGGFYLSLERFMWALVAMDPRNWSAQRLSPPRDRVAFFNRIKTYIKKEAGL